MNELTHTFTHSHKKQSNAKNETAKRKGKGKSKDSEPTRIEKLLSNPNHWKATEENAFRELYKHAKVIDRTSLDPQSFPFIHCLYPIEMILVPLKHTSQLTLPYLPPIFYQAHE